MKTHILKIDDEYLDNLLSKRKRCEIRFNDRDYQKGDHLEFTKYSFDKPEKHLFEIVHIHSGLGMKEGYVVLSVDYIAAGQ